MWNRHCFPARVAQRMEARLSFYANGFVKDMDFYEASPFTVADMPFHGMSTIRTR